MLAIADPDNMDAPSETRPTVHGSSRTLVARKIRGRLGLMYVEDQFFAVLFGRNFVSLGFSSDASVSTLVLPTYPKAAWR